METTITIMKTQKTLREKVIFGLSVVLFAVLYLVPGLSGSYAEAQCGGGGGGGGGNLCDEWTEIDGTYHKFGAGGACYQCGLYTCHSNTLTQYCQTNHSTCQ
jgi:hypothetical protein